MASAIAAARQQINAVGADGDLDGARAPGEIDLDVDSVADPIELPDGKLIYPPKLHGEPIDRIACALLDMQQPSRSRFLRMTGPPGWARASSRAPSRCGSGSSAAARSSSGRGEPFYGYVELSGGPSSDEYLFRYEFVPTSEGGGGVRLVDSAFVAAMQQRLDGDDRRAQHDPRRRAAVAE